MNEAGHTYVPPRIEVAPPPPVADYLDGTNLPQKTQALRLSTIDPAGWPHAALLSAGDMLILPSGRFRLVIFPDSTTTANLMRDHRLTVTVALGEGIWEMRLNTRRLTHTSPDVPLAFFDAELESARLHRAPYAAVTSGITFALHEPDAVLPRWQRQIAAMRAAT
jgi:hypothetical protein